MSEKLFLLGRCLIVSLLCASAVSADPAAQLFSVRLRALFGDGNSLEHASLTVGDSIGDLRRKLERLKKYSSYQLVKDETRVIPVSQMETVSLGDYGDVTIRPISSLDDVVTVWLRWSKADMEILNTKLKFRCKDALLTGVENEERGGVLLAVNVTPEAQK